MSDNTEHEEVLDPAEAAAEAEAAAAALAGYQARAKAPALSSPAAVVTDAPATAASGNDGADHATAAPAAAAQPAAVPDLLDDEPDEPPASLESALAQLKELRESLKSVKGSEDTIRRLNGEIGSIKRNMLQMAKAPASPANPATAPADDELAAALKAAEGAADAFPEVGGPLATALKAVAARTTAQQPGMTPEQIAEIVQQQVAVAAQQSAIQSLAKVHPDYETVRSTPAFEKWIAAQPAEYAAELNNTWDAAVVSDGLTKFKAELQRQQKARESKQNRLAAAVTPPRSGAAKGGPSTIPDEEGFNAGYNKVRRLNSATQSKR